MSDDIRYKLIAGGPKIEAHEVLMGREYIGMVSRHPGTKKWAATWNLVPTNSDAFPFESKRDATIRLIAQARNVRRRR